MLTLSKGPSRGIPLCPQMNTQEKTPLGRRSVQGQGGGCCWWPRVASLPNSSHLIGVGGPGKPLLLLGRCSLCCGTTHQGRVMSETPRVFSRFIQLLQGILPTSNSPQHETAVDGLLFEKQCIYVTVVGAPPKYRSVSLKFRGTSAFKLCTQVAH